MGGWVDAGVGEDMGAAGWVVVQDMALYHDPEHAGKKREMEPLEREGVAIRTA